MSTTAPLHVSIHNTCSLTKMMRKTVKRGTSIPVALHRVPCDGQGEYGHVHLWGYSARDRGIRAPPPLFFVLLHLNSEISLLGH